MSPRPVPQVIAHRGKAAHPSQPHLSHLPENTLEAFTAAATSGADALETDLRMTKDGVLVLCHDRSLQRCFGQKRLVDECTWAELTALRTVQAPHARMPRLEELLEWLNSADGAGLWVLLDIKLDNLPETIMPALAGVFGAVPGTQGLWAERVVLGCWSGAYFGACERYLPGFETALICFDVRYARGVLRGTEASVNVNQKVLMGMGHGFVEEVHRGGRRVFVWTVNEGSLMRWSIAKGVDGVVTDDPVRCRGMVQDVEKGMDGDGREDVTMSQRAHAWALSLLVMMFGWVFRRRVLSKLEKRGRME